MQPSLPNRPQLTHGAERVLAVFLVGAVAYLHLHQDFSRATLHAAFLAGVTAAYQLVLSTLTSH